MPDKPNPNSHFPPMKKSAGDIISPEFIEEIKERLVEGKRIRRKMPMEGRLNIDRPLPFLLVYRRSSRKRMKVPAN